jgi:hypothetical protein
VVASPHRAASPTSTIHRTNWLSGYRTVLGFAYLILGKPELDLG